jgi:hypothetical protein
LIFVFHIIIPLWHPYWTTLLSTYQLQKSQQQNFLHDDSWHPNSSLGVFRAPLTTTRHSKLPWKLGATESCRRTFWKRVWCLDHPSPPPATRNSPSWQNLNGPPKFSQWKCIMEVPTLHKEYSMTEISLPSIVCPIIMESSGGEAWEWGMTSSLFSSSFPLNPPRQLLVACSMTLSCVVNTPICSSSLWKGGE